MKKVAFFVDWDNLRKIIQKIKGTSKKAGTPLSNFDFNNSSHISKLFSSFLEADEEFYRIFFYTAKPLTDDDILSQLRKAKDKKNFQTYVAPTPNRIYNIAQPFLENIVRENYIALRTGKMQVRGADSTGRPDLVQKQVDMLIGLDISEVSYNKHAEKILVFSKDTDMIPALKTARINGLTVLLANFVENGFISPDLVKHSDVIRTKSLVTIDSNI